MPTTSLRLLRQAGVGQGSQVLDVGSGASRLPAFLLALGARVTVVDIAPAALQQARQQLGEQAAQVDWLVADITRPARQLGGPFDAWHDRAVFHFLIDEADRERYRQTLAAKVGSGGHAVVATFAPDGPETCSGLPVQRYSADELVAALGPDWELVQAEREVHSTPWGAVQPFTFVLAIRR